MEMDIVMAVQVAEPDPRARDTLRLRAKLLLQIAGRNRSHSEPNGERGRPMKSAMPVNQRPNAGPQRTALGKVDVQTHAKLRRLAQPHDRISESGAGGDQAGRRDHTATMGLDDCAIDAAGHPQIVGVDHQLLHRFRRSVRGRR